MNLTKIVAVLIVLLVTITVGVSFFGDRIVSRFITAGQVEQYLSRILNRNVSVGEVTFTLWSGVELRKVTVGRKRAPEKYPLLRARSVSLHPDWWSLLFLELRLNRTSISSPKFYLVRGSKGRWNLPYVGRGDSSSQARRDYPQEKRTGGKQSPQPSQYTSVTVDLFRFTNGRITLVDRRIGETFDVGVETLTLHDFNPQRGATLEVSNLTALSGTINGSFRFFLNPFKFTIDRVKGEKLSLSKVLPYLKNDLPAVYTPRSTHLSFELKQSGYEPPVIRMKGSVLADSITLSKRLAHESTLDSVKLKGGIEFNTETSRLSTQLSRLRLNNATLQGTMDVNVTPPWRNPGLSGKLRVRSESVQPFLQFARNLEDRIPSSFTLRGPLKTSKLQLKGSAGSPEVSGKLSFGNLRINEKRLIEPLQLTDFRIRMSHPQSLKFTGDVHAYGGTISTDGKVEDYRTSGGSQLSLNLSGRSLQFKKLLAQGRSIRPFPEILTGATGTLKSVEVSLSGSPFTHGVTAEGTFKGTTVSLRNVESDINSLRGVFSFANSTLEIRDLQGEYGRNSFSARGRVALPIDSASDFKVVTTFEGFPLAEVLSLAPEGTLPEGFNFSGSVSADHLRVDGPVSNLSVKGSSSLADGTVRYSALEKPLRNLSTLVKFQGSEALVKDLKGKVDNHPFRGHGKITLREPRRLDLEIGSSDLPASTVKRVYPVSSFLPEGWEPRGKADLEARITGKLTRPETRLNIRSTEFAVGEIKSDTISAGLALTGSGLTLKSLRASLLGGRLESSGTFNLKAPLLTDLTVEATGLSLSHLLSAYFPFGENSEGTLKGTLQLKGPLRNRKSLNGEVRVTGRNLVLRDVNLFGSLSKTFDSGLARVVTGGKLLPIDAKASSRFDTGIAKLRLESGTGKIRTLRLVNDELVLDGNGSIDLKGTLDLSFQLIPKPTTLKEMDRDWLRKAVRDGLPPLKVSGTVTNPKFHLDSFTKKIKQNVLWNQLKRNLDKTLEDIFN